MAKNYNVIITNGSGSEAITEGNYTVSATVPGYNNSSIDPSSLTIDSQGTYNLTISADGTLTLHVTETGEASGTAVAGAVFYRCDALGTTYGDPITSNASGDAVFNNVPYAIDASEPNIYFKQTESDGSHDFSSEIYSKTLTSETTTEQITNTPAATKTINVTDANYSGLPINGTINLSN